MYSQTMEQAAGLRFMGVGSSASEELGTAAAVLEADGRPALLIDCGHGTPQQFAQIYNDYPRALFITHVHLDHISGLEQLHGRVALDSSRQEPVRIYVPASIVATLHKRVGTLARSLAESETNFWDVFQIIPVGSGFWHRQRWFDVFEVRHHAPEFAFGIRLAGSFLYTGDTRPIPEVLRFYGGNGEILFHDCALAGNPSHTGWADIEREYEPAIRQRLVVYHYESAAAGMQLIKLGATVARPGQLIRFGQQNSYGGLRIVRDAG